jgi:hypothetical protein
LLCGERLDKFDGARFALWPRLQCSLFIEEHEVLVDAVDRARADECRKFSQTRISTGLGQFSDCENYFFLAWRQVYFHVFSPWLNIMNSTRIRRRGKAKSSAKAEITVENLLRMDTFGCQITQNMPEQ